MLRSAFRREHERLVVVEAARAPAAREIAALVAAHERSWHDPRRRVEIVLRLGPLGFPLNPELPAALHRGLLVPATVPDVFLQLGEPEVPWSDYAAWYLGEWETNDQWTDATPGERRTLSRLAATARAGRIVYSPSPFPS